MKVNSDKLSQLNNVMMRMQQLDRNGGWDEVIGDIKNGDDDLKEKVQYTIDTLKEWHSDEPCKEYLELIKTLKDIKE